MVIKVRRTACQGAISRRRGRRVLRRSLNDLHEELRMLIPGGRRLSSEELLSLTADYIMFLRSKVKVLRAIAMFYMP
ncbi:hypothetical protein QJS04_geneDACA013281 [Acorus gramineus]|uniref:BHLH domain-containing protein n=1 Tax=Acorus gramineus TaxID=55184 RepID=A0AAV9BAI8_ACOGR|nr:hypothetical protein QJS04_geneDACA013281 [Acorus gramineus]